MWVSEPSCVFMPSVLNGTRRCDMYKKKKKVIMIIIIAFN